MPWRDTLKEHYPDALFVGDLATRVRLALLSTGLDASKVLFGNVLCRDELNTPTVRRFAKDWGENFSLAGLGGFPTAGKTGIGAYASHLPKKGTLLVLYGPHIGIDGDGSLGMAEREGMKNSTPSCGALMAFHDKVAEDGNYYPDDDPMDIEQVALERAMLWQFKKDKDATLMNAAYAAVDDNVDKLLPTDTYPRQVRIGGILINTPSAGDDHFDLRRAQLFDKGAEPVDLMEQILNPEFED